MWLLSLLWLLLLLIVVVVGFFFFFDVMSFSFSLLFQHHLFLQHRYSNALVLPEYMIEFELVPKQDTSSSSSSFSSSSSSSNDSSSSSSSSSHQRKDPATVAKELFGRELSSQELVDIRPMLRPLERFHDQCDRVIGQEDSVAAAHTAMSALENGTSLVDGDDASLAGGGEVNGWSTGDNGDNVDGQGCRSPGVHLGADVGNGNDNHGGGYKSGASVLSLPPHLPSRPKLFVITPASVLKQVSPTNSKQQNDRLNN